MAHNFHDINGLLLFGIERHEGLHILPPAPPVFMPFWKLNLLHPFTMGGNEKPTVLFNGVPSVVHGHEPQHLWPHIGIIPDPLDALTPLHIVFGVHKCWLPRGAVEICGEKATCCVIGGPLSLNADCWDLGKWPTSLVLDPGTVQTTPTVGDFFMGAVTLAVDLVIDLAFRALMKVGGGLLKKLGSRVLKPLLQKGKDALKRGLSAAVRRMGSVGRALGRAARRGMDKATSALRKAKCFFTGHPVDATSGRVVDTKIDLTLPGAIPLVWERHYSSARALERTSLGRGGWAHSFEQWVEQDEEGITLRDEQGRDLFFPRVNPGESAFHRPDRLTLTAHEGGGFSVYSHETRLTRQFEPAASGGRALLREVRDAHRNAITLEYSGERLRRITDTAGREVRAKLTHGGRIARIEVWARESLEQWVDYAYTKMGELASATDALGHVEHYAYDEDHRMVKTTLKNGVSFHYEYDPETGWCKKTWGDSGLHTVEIRPDLEKRITYLLCNEEPRILHWNEDGLVVREETPDGILIRTSEYDRDQHLVAEANGAGGTTRYAYDERGNKVKETDPAENVAEWEYEDDQPVLQVGPDGLLTRYAYDARGSLTAVTYPSQVSYSLSYDEQGHLREIQGEEGLFAAFTIDAQHNVVEEVDARSAQTTYAFDRLGRPLVRSDALGRRTEVAYDRLGQPIALQRPDGTSTTSAYDPLGNPVRVTDALGQVTEMEYAGTGVLTKLVQPDGREWRFKYTPQEKLRRIENPLGEAYEFAYDTAGRVIEETTFDGRMLRYGYSAGGRLARVDYPDGSFRAFNHEPLGNVLREESTDGPMTFQRDRMGRLLGAVLEQDGRQVVTLFERDRLGRVVAEVQDGRKLRYEYDARGRRTARVMPDGATTRYRHDALGELIGLEHDGYEIAVERDLLGRETARRDAFGKVAIRSAYDSMDRLIEQRVEARAPGGGVPSAVVQRMWQYDALGRVKLVEDGRWGATAYRHDAVGQLLEARRGARREVFAYDAAGSIQKMLEGLEASPEQAAQAEPWEIGKGNLLLGTERARYEYDKRGRRALKLEGGKAPEAKRTEYIWDCRDRLREVKLPSGERVVFAYDAFGRRVRKEVQEEDGELQRAVDFVWDGDVLAADVDSRYGARCFVHAPGTFVPLLQAERGEVFSYVTDHVGVPKELIDQRGRVAWSAAHSAWGRVTDRYVDSERAERPGRAIESPFQLLGQYADEETGLCYTRFRYFDAGVGRWCSPDPLGVCGGLDLFGFNGSPISTADPFGLATVDPDMMPGDIEAGVLRDGSYIANPNRVALSDLTVTPGGKLKNGNQLMNGKYMYVVDNNGNMMFGTRAGRAMPHPTLVGGRDPTVQSAGIIDIRGGKIHSIDSASGHFKPGAESLGSAKEAVSHLDKKVFAKDFQFQDHLGNKVCP
jgi:RHS repeat-associated protein